MKNSITFTEATIFAREYNGRMSYSLGISDKKYENGQKTDEWINAYMNVQFLRDNAPRDKQKINITKAFLAPYADRNGNAQLKVIVQEWSAADDGYPWMG